MFIRQKKNRSGSVSVQIISKHGGRYKVEKTIGSGTTQDRIIVLLHQARYELEKMEQRVSLFVSDRDTAIEGYLQTLENIQIRTIGPELIFGKIYDAIGFNAIGGDLFGIW